MRVMTSYPIPAAVAVLLATGCGSISQTPKVTLEAGTEVRVAPATPLSPMTEQAGDEFMAKLDSPLMKGEEIVAPRGSTVTGEVVDAQPARAGEQGAFLSLELKEIKVNEKDSVAVKTDPVRYVPDAHSGKAETPSAESRETPLTFRLAEPVQIPVELPSQQKPIPIS
jgi:hypothetical protein